MWICADAEVMFRYGYTKPTRFAWDFNPKTAIEKFFQNSSTRNAVFGCAPGKSAATWVKVPPVELDGSRPKEMPGKRPRGRICKRGIF